MTKIRVAGVKFALGADGGTERYLQAILANLPKDDFEVDAYYTNAAPYLGSDWKHPDNNPDNLKYLEDHGVNLIPINVEFKDVRTATHEWVGTDFYEKFDESKYDVLITARAGHSEAPYCHLKKVPIVELVTLPGMADNQSNIVKSVHISNFQRETWIKAGGNPNITEVIPLFSEQINRSNRYLRDKLGIKDSDFVFGFHQRPDDGIYFPASLAAYKEIMNDNTHFIIMGGSQQYSQAAMEMGLKNFHQLSANGSDNARDEFLNTLSVFAHARKDGETFGLAIAEAMSYGLPVLSHYAPANGHVETIGDGGFVCSNVSEYAGYMKRLMDNSDFYKDLSTKALNRYRNALSLKVNMEKFIRIFQEVIDEKMINNMDADDFWNEQYKE